MEATIPMLGVTTGSASTPSQSQETDMFRSTFTKTMCLPKWSITAFVDSVIRSISSSSPMDQRSSEPWAVWIMALPIRPSAQPMPRFLLLPPKPPLTCPLKWVRASMES